MYIIWEREKIMKDDNNYNYLLDTDLIKKLVVGIGEVSSITEVPIRQIRYWEQKGIIESVNNTSNSTRRYNYTNIKKIMLIKELIDEGYTLDASAKKVEQRLASINKAFAKLAQDKENGK